MRVVNVEDVVPLRAARPSKYEPVFARAERLEGAKCLLVAPKRATLTSARCLLSYLYQVSRRRGAPAGRRFRFAITEDFEVSVRLEARKR